MKTQLNTYNANDQKFVTNYINMKEDINMKVARFERYAVFALKVVAVLIGWLAC